MSSPSSLVYVEQGEAAGVRAADLRHLPGPQEDSWDEKWTAKLQAVNESLPFGPLPARESSEGGSGQGDLFKEATLPRGALQEGGLGEQTLPPHSGEF